VINPLSAAAASGIIAALNDGLRQLGYIQGQSIALDYHYLEGNFDLIPSVVDGLVKAGTRVLVVGGTTPAIAVAKATTAVPIAFVGVSDPVGAGLAVSLARPGRNATGVATAHEDAYAGKSLELLKEIVPSASAKSYSCWITRRGCTLAWNPNQASPVGAGGKRRHPRAHEDTDVGADEPEA